MRGGTAWCLLTLVLCSLTAPRAQDGAPARVTPAAATRAWSAPTTTASGGVARLAGGDLDLVGTMQARIDVPVTPANGWWFDLTATTAIEKSLGDFTFAVRQLDTHVDLGWRWTTTAGDVGPFVGQATHERVDADGSRWIRYAGITWRPRGAWRVGAHTFDVDAALAAVVERSNVEGSALARAGAHWTWRRRRWSLGADATVDALGGGGHVRADVLAGPRVDVVRTASSRISLYARRLTGHNPLGLQTSGTLLGFEIAAATDALTETGAATMHGHLAAGAGAAGRSAAQFALTARTPESRPGITASVAVDGHVLTSSGTSDLYYFVNAGIEKRWLELRWGAYLYHRSGHRLAEKGKTVESFNVADVGVETLQWDASVARADLAAWGRLDFRVRAGYFLTSTFGLNRREYLGGGVRWSAPWAVGRALPFVRLELEHGDVERWVASVGLGWPHGLSLRAEAGRDTGLFSVPRWFLLLGGWTF